MNRACEDDFPILSMACLRPLSEYAIWGSCTGRESRRLALSTSWQHEANAPCVLYNMLQHNRLQL
jgi:hypothetical protein